MSADVEVLTGAKDSALVVPIQALVAHPERVVRRWEKLRAEEGKAGSRGKKARSEAMTEEDTTGTSGKEKLIEGIFVDRKGSARFVPVKLGLRGDTHIEVAGRSISRRRS